MASLSAAVTLPAVVYLLPQREGTAMVWFAGALSVFVVWSHRSNIGRLLKGEEGSFRRAALEGGPEQSPERSPETGKDPA